jgi:adenosylmethionine-8-amino-7-oxononanoate aminotransferase
LAATLITEEIYNASLGTCEDFKTFFHSHSFIGIPLSCAVALANLAFSPNEITLTNLRPKIAALKRLLRSLAKLPQVGDIRQQGFMAGIELVKDRATKEAHQLGTRIGHLVAREAR